LHDGDRPENAQVSPTPRHLSPTPGNRDLLMGTLELATAAAAAATKVRYVP
jgi:hypothetical protein